MSGLIADHKSLGQASRFHRPTISPVNSLLCLCRDVSFWFFFFGPRALRFLGKRSITELNPQPRDVSF